jgi:hypothetical protein
MFRRSVILLSLLLLSWPRPCGAMTAPPGPPASCDLAAAAAERTHHLPAGLLAAIGRVESGRPDAAGHVRPWPWTIDAAGAGAWLASAAAAVAAVEALQRQGQRNIDLGCFQVNLQHHPAAFATLAAAFDRQTNAEYAAGFLAALYARTGSWPDAVAAYHSASPAQGTAYRTQVFAQWAQTPPPDGPPAPPPGGEVVIAGVHIWTPLIAGNAPRIVRISSPGASLAP